MTQSEFNKYSHLLKLSYVDIVSYLKIKYGEVLDNYYSEKSYHRFLRGEIKSISRGKYKRTSEGLYTHHILENQYENIGNKQYIKDNEYPYEYQKKENLVYADHMEHMILHIIIMKETEGDYGSNGFRMIRDTCVSWFIWQLDPKMQWMKSVIKRIDLNRYEISKLIMLVDGIENEIRNNFKNSNHMLINRMMASFSGTELFWQLIGSDVTLGTIRRFWPRYKNFVSHRLKKGYLDAFVLEHGWKDKSLEHKKAIYSFKKKIDEFYDKNDQNNCLSEKDIVKSFESLLKPYFIEEAMFKKKDIKYWQIFNRQVSQFREENIKEQVNDLHKALIELRDNCLYIKIFPTTFVNKRNENSFFKTCLLFSENILFDEVYKIRKKKNAEVENYIKEQEIIELENQILLESRH